MTETYGPFTIEVYEAPRLCGYAWDIEFQGRTHTVGGPEDTEAEALNAARQELRSLVRGVTQQLNDVLGRNNDA